MAESVTAVILYSIRIKLNKNYENWESAGERAESMQTNLITARTDKLNQAGHYGVWKAPWEVCIFRFVSQMHLNNIDRNVDRYLIFERLLNAISKMINTDFLMFSFN